MASVLPSPTVTFFTRPGCHLCDMTRDILGAVIAERAAAGRTVPAIAEVDISTDAALERLYLTTIPVLRIGDAELELATRAGAIRLFLSAALDESAPPRWSGSAGARAPRPA